MDEDQWMYDNIMSEEVDMDNENEQECGVNEQHVDCSDAFNTSQVFTTRDDVLQWARSVAHENGFVAVIMRSDTNTAIRGKISFVLIGCERSGQYRSRKKDFVRRDTGSRKCGCPFKLRGKPVVGGECWMVKLMCESHNHELVKSLVGHSYVERLTKDENTIIVDMTKSMVKPKNILLTLKEHNVNSCTTIKQIYNARSAYRSSIRGSDTEMQHLMKLLKRDQYIHWHRLKDEDVVRDIFWCHPNAVKLCNACNLVFLIDSTYKTNRYRFPLLDFVGVTPTRMIFSAGFAYLEGECVNNVVESAHWALKRVLQNSLGDLCSIWDVMNNMITLQHTEIKTSFETSTHVVEHVFKVTLYKRLLSMVSRYVLNQIAAEYERVHYAGKNPSRCGCVMRTKHDFKVLNANNEAPNARQTNLQGKQIAPGGEEA
ncbi:Protein FAR1-RELATED SEQUENCE 6 [Glycine max]|nr:Protein FAR1-RELATED SEQUENCE 6 [Glycine max]